MWPEIANQEELLKGMLACVLDYLDAETAFLAVRHEHGEAYRLIPLSASGCADNWRWQTVLSRCPPALPLQIIDFAELPESVRPEAKSGSLVLFAINREPVTYLGAVLNKKLGNGEHEKKTLSLIGQLCAYLWQGSLEWQRELSKAVLEERHRLRREIHDSIAQTVSYLVMRLSSLILLVEKHDLAGLERGLRELLEITHEAYLGLRETLFSLRTPGPPDAGLASLLETYAKEFEERSGIKTKIVRRGECRVVLPPSATTQLLRIVQEALTNVRKHARASEAEILLEHTADGQLLLQIKDDGCGFDPEVPGSRRHQFGISSMRERAKAVGARLEIETAPGMGTAVKVLLPGPKKGWTGEQVTHLAG